MSADNAVRGPAEKMYSEQRKTNPDLVASCLMTTVLESSDVQLQVGSSVFFPSRRLVSSRVVSPLLAT